MHNKIKKKEYGVFLNRLKEEIVLARQKTYRDINKRLVETYKDYPKLSPLVTVLSWSNNLLILFQTQSTEEKEFYLRVSAQENWSRRELERQIDSSLYERFMISKRTDKLIAPKKDKNLEMQFKDDYVFDFLGLKEDFQEEDLRKAIIGSSDVL